jgi:hypothetical protein
LPARHGKENWRIATKNPIQTQGSKYQISETCCRYEGPSGREATSHRPELHPPQTPSISDPNTHRRRKGKTKKMKAKKKVRGGLSPTPKPPIKMIREKGN